MLDRFFAKRKLRDEVIHKAREDFTSWMEIARSNGWKVYEEEVSKEIEIIKNQIYNNTELSGEELKRLQLALQVWKKVQRIPKKLEDNAKTGGK